MHFHGRHRLKIQTPDGSGQAVHPDVLYVAEGHLGFNYWMACTPYPYGADQHENPIIRVSDDGLTWNIFPGAPDPLVNAPSDNGWHHADTDLVLKDHTLHLFYITTQSAGSQTIFFVITSIDGINWTAPVDVYRTHWGVSPSVCVDSKGRWLMWHISLDTLDRFAFSSLLMRTGADAFSFGEPTRCQLEIPGYMPWHIDVIQTEAGFEALVAAFPMNTNPSICRLFWASSLDGVVWTLRHPRPVLRPSFAGWDNRMIYRSTFLKKADGSYRVWFSAASWGMKCGIGHLEGMLHTLESNPSEAIFQEKLFQKIREDALGFAKYAAFRLLPPTAYQTLLFLWRRFRNSIGVS